MQTALKQWDTAGALAVFAAARGSNARTAPRPYWYLCGRLENWFARAYDRLGVRPPDALYGRCVCDPAGLLAHLRAVAAGEDPPPLFCDPCRGPGDALDDPSPPPARPRKERAQTKRRPSGEIFALLGISSWAELPAAIREAPKVATLEIARAWDPIAESFCARRDRVRALGIDPDDESPAAWVRRRSVLMV